jgi:hypothetical protein
VLVYKSPKSTNNVSQTLRSQTATGPFNAAGIQDRSAKSARKTTISSSRRAKALTLLPIRPARDPRSENFLVDAGQLQWPLHDGSSTGSSSTLSAGTGERKNLNPPHHRPRELYEPAEARRGLNAFCLWTTMTETVIAYAPSKMTARELAGDFPLLAVTALSERQDRDSLRDDHSRPNCLRNSSFARISTRRCAAVRLRPARLM